MCTIAAHSSPYLCAKHLNSLQMENSLILSSRVIKSIKSLPVADRGAISSAITAEYILGDDPSYMLTPFQSMLYSMIKWYVEHDNAHLQRGEPLE